jgi:hypothetical protein
MKPIQHRGDMFARKVGALLKPNSLSEFTRLMENEILFWLQKQEGFLDLITLAVPDSMEVATISFWDRSESAHAYNASGYPEALKILANLLDGTPYVKTYEVVSSTLQKLDFARNLVTENPVHETRTSQLTYRPYETSL